jgi:hypothetical protein
MTRPIILAKLRALERSQESNAEYFAQRGYYTTAKVLRIFAADTAAIRTLLELHPLRSDSRERKPPPGGPL